MQTNDDDDDDDDDDDEEDTSIRGRPYNTWSHLLSACDLWVWYFQYSFTSM